MATSSFIAARTVCLVSVPSPSEPHPRLTAGALQQGLSMAYWRIPKPACWEQNLGYGQSKFGIPQLMALECCAKRLSDTWLKC